MNIVGISACTSGIAHTYIAKEKLIKAGQALGHNIHVETQGTIGTQDALKAEDIAAFPFCHAHSSPFSSAEASSSPSAGAARPSAGM